MKRSVWAAIAALAVIWTFCVPAAFSQAVYGSILGTVTDPTGAAVNGAKVTAISQSKSVSTEAKSNESGNYAITHLIPDVYTIRVEAQGFKTLEFKDVQVSADTGSRVDGQFQIGGTTETVEVTSEAPQLKTDRADVAIELSSQQVNELPVINRNFQSLELLTPGTQTLTGWSHAATENPQGSKQIFVDGQHFSGTGYGLDGTDNQDPILGIIIVNPSLDTVTETKIATQNYDAEFGKATAGIMTAQTKSGSNSFHGSGYFYELDPKDPAKDPTANAPVLNNWKQYGGTIGGPILKNKLFFFGGYEGTRRNSGVAMTIGVPTALVSSTCLAGASGPGYCDLSEYTNNAPSGNGFVYNPYMAAGARTLYTCTGGVGGCPVSASGPLTTQIPLSVLQQWDPNGAAEHILSLLPAPNTAGNAGGTQQNYAASGSGSFNDYQYTTREDYSVTQKLQIFGRYSHAHFSLNGSPVFGTTIGGPGLGYLGLAGQSNINNYSVAAGFNYTFGSSVLTDFRFGYFRYNPHSTKWDQSNTSAATNLGLFGLNTSDATTAGLPALVFKGNESTSVGTIGYSNQGTSSDGLGEGLNVSRCNCPLIEKEQGYQFANNWTKIFGNHQFKVGVDLRHAINLRVPSDANRTGILNFDFQGTSDGQASATGGLDIATFLFGEVTSFNRYIGSTLEPTDQERQNRYFVYAQDTWRVTHKLTVNYGLRWEFYGPEYTNGANSGGYAELPEGIIRVAGVGGISSNGNTANSYKDFAPRLGVAYEVNAKTVVRLGYGRSFDIGVFGSNFGHTVTQNLPVLANQQLTSLSGDSKTAAFDFAADASGNCIPLPTAIYGATPPCGPAAPATAFPVVPSNGILPLYGICPEAVAQANGGVCSGNVSPHMRPDKVVVPTVDAWNATLQRQLTSTTSIEAAYIGTHGSHVFRGDGPTYNNNQPTIVGFASGVSRDARTPYNGAFSTPYTYADGYTANIVCCNAGQSFGWAGNDGTNSYNAFQVKVNQRAAKGLTFLAHYTYSKAYDNDGSYSALYSVAWGRSDFNRDSVFVFAPIYELPFGRGKTFLGNIGRAADLLIGGWQINTALTIGSGLPWTPSYSNCGVDEDTGPCRPTLIGGFHVGVTGSPGNLRYFTPESTALCDNPAATACAGGVVTQTGPWAAPGVGNFGNIQRNSFTGPGEFKTDMSFFKTFNITERLHAQFRAEFFNIFNHPVYGFNVNQTGTGTSIDNPGAGVINSLESDVTMRQFQVGVRVEF